MIKEKGIQAPYYRAAGQVSVPGFNRGMLLQQIAWLDLHVSHNARLRRVKQFLI
jgi:hypothetical protein